jgi:polysaccharide deacetylase family protein (PEP-CTERM system associated)
VSIITDVKVVTSLTGGTMSPLNAFTIDLEDWYHGIEQPFESWDRFEDRIRIGTDKLLEILNETETCATFFVLGWIANKHPTLIRTIAESGHEIATHGYDHEKFYHIDRGRLRQTLDRAKKCTEDVSGQPVVGHRAPYFSLTGQSLWAIEVLQELGFLYDASIYPGLNWRYGIPNTPQQPYLLNDSTLIEYPVSMLSLWSRQLGIGGAYFRILPYSVTRNALMRLNQQRQFASFYIHPWELDPTHQVIGLRWKAMATHYFNLWSTAPRLKRLLHEIPFTSMGEIISHMKTLPRHYLKPQN